MFKKLELWTLFISILLIIFVAGDAFPATITLQWDPNTETDLAGYKVYYGEVTGCSEEDAPDCNNPNGPYNGRNADEGDSPVNILLPTLSDPQNPEFTLNGLDENKKYFFVVTAHDDENLESDYSNEVSTADAVPPILTLVGPATITLERYTEYTDTGATSTDNFDGDITNRIVVTNNLDNTKVGSYAYTYVVTDNEGNTATIIRNINVVDTTSPINPIRLRCK